MVIQRGEIWWADLAEPRGSEPGYRRPLLIVQADAFNRSRIATTIGVVVTSNLALVEAPGNVLLPKRASGLPKDSVANVSQVVTVDRATLTEPAGKLSGDLMAAVDRGLRLSLSL
ncbi:MAG: type II toxin-antitoxin system PemK/MazF family toxin [Gemmatimonadales bacterium]